MVSFPLVRAAGRGRALLADSRVDRKKSWFKKKKPNGYLVDSSGNVEGVFTFGDGIQDVLVSPDDIVVMYFDEGIFEALGGPSSEGRVTGVLRRTLARAGGRGIDADSSAGATRVGRKSRLRPDASDGCRGARSRSGVHARADTARAP